MHYWPFVRGIHRSPVNSPHKGQLRGTLMFSLICTQINGWVNNGEAGDLRHYRAHYDVTVMRMTIPAWWCLLLFGLYLAQPLGKTMLTITVYVPQAAVLGWAWGKSSKQVFGEEPTSIHIRVFFREEILSWYCLLIIRLYQSKSFWHWMNPKILTALHWPQLPPPTLEMNQNPLAVVNHFSAMSTDP